MTCILRHHNECGCAPGGCRIEARRKDDEAKFRRIIAKRNANTALMMFGSALSITALISAFVFVAIPESQRIARANQENVYVQR